MKPNVEKFQFMLLCPDGSYDESITVNVEEISLKNQHEVNLLGICIDNSLVFKTHAKAICKKANAKLQILKRLSGYLSFECRLVVLQCFIISQFMFCSTLLIFTSKFYKDKIERILYRGLKFVFNDYNSSYEYLLKMANVDSMELVRQKSLIHDLFKCLHEIGPKCMAAFTAILWPKIMEWTSLGHKNCQNCGGAKR